MKVKLFVLVVLIAASSATAAEDVTNRALRILLAASATPIPLRSSCAGNLPGVAQPTVGALVASRLATFGDGENRVTGSCDRSGTCSVSIVHSAGDDIENMELRFRTKAGRLLPATLQCLSTP